MWEWIPLPIQMALNKIWREKKHIQTRIILRLFWWNSDSEHQRCSMIVKFIQKINVYDREIERESGREDGKKRIYTERIFWNKIYIPNRKWNYVLGTIIRKRNYLKFYKRVGCCYVSLNIERNLRTFTSITKSPVEDHFLSYMFWFETGLTLIRLSNKMHNVIAWPVAIPFCTFIDWPIAHCPLPIYLLHVSI